MFVSQSDFNRWFKEVPPSPREFELLKIIRSLQKQNDMLEYILTEDEQSRLQELRRQEAE